MSSSNPTDAAFTFFVLSWFAFSAGWRIGVENENKKIRWDLYCKESSNGSTTCIFPQDLEAAIPGNSKTGNFNE